MNGVNSGFVENFNMILATDFYQLTMGAAYFQYNLENNVEESDDIATFELFISNLRNSCETPMRSGLVKLDNAATRPRHRAFPRQQGQARESHREGF